MLGGPGCGKTQLGCGLQRVIQGLCYVSGGDLARLATTDGARKSPLLNSIGRQLGDRRRRKLATRRLVEVATEVLVDGLKNKPNVAFLITDGFRVADFAGFERAHGCRISCVIRIRCSRETMLARLQGRGSRKGDDKLGLFDTTDDAGRIEAYLHREQEEDDALRAYLGDDYTATVCLINGECPAEECLRAAADALCAVAQRRGLPWNLDVVSCGGLEPALVAEIDWEKQFLATAARLDMELHPDGRPRTRQQQ